MLLIYYVISATIMSFVDLFRWINKVFAVIVGVKICHFHLLWVPVVWESIKSIVMACPTQTVNFFSSHLQIFKNKLILVNFHQIKNEAGFSDIRLLSSLAYNMSNAHLGIYGCFWVGRINSKCPPPSMFNCYKMEWGRWRRSSTKDYFSCCVVDSGLLVLWFSDQERSLVFSLSGFVLSVWNGGEFMFPM